LLDHLGERLPVKIFLLTVLLSFSSYANFSHSGRGLLAAQSASNELDVTWTPQWSNLKAYWPMDGKLGVISSGGKINDQKSGAFGTAQNGSMSFVSGKIGQSVQGFDPTSYFSVPQSGAWNVCSSMTVSGWIRWDAPTSSNFGAMLSSWNNCNADSGFSIAQCSTTKTMCLSFNTSAVFNQALSTTAAPLDGTWHHIAFTLSPAGLVKFYMDGSEEILGSISMGTGICTPNTPLTFGKGGCSGPWGGQMDEVAIWNSVLSQTEIQKIYNRQSNGTH
jgi:Concanavalin A-like lectin/glucanases superfamily